MSTTASEILDDVKAKAIYAFKYCFGSCLGWPETDDDDEENLLLLGGDPSTAQGTLPPLNVPNNVPQQGLPGAMPNKPKVDPNIAALKRVHDDLDPRYAEVDSSRDRIVEKDLLKVVDDLYRTFTQHEAASKDDPLELKNAVSVGRKLISEVKKAQARIRADGDYDYEGRYREVANDFDNFRKAAKETPCAEANELLVKIGEAEMHYSTKHLPEALNAGLLAAEIEKQLVIVARARQEEEEKKKSAVAEKEKKERTERVELESKTVDDKLKAIEKGDLKSIKDFYLDLKPGRTNVDEEELGKLRTRVVEGVLKNKERRQAIASDPVLCADMAMLAADLNVLTSEMLEDFGDKKSAIATKVLLENCGTAEKDMNKDLHQFMWDGVELKDWNDKGKGVGAQVYNELWNAGDYDHICALVAKGVDPLQAHSLGQDSGRGNREGIWSGYIQPLEHLLGNYVRKVDTLKNTANEISDEEKPKVEGAEKILEALKKSGKTSVLTSYKEVKESEALQQFEDNPGTIWGFEDVRLPYVQAARETKHGQQPLRMWEMWKAIENALNEAGYDKLLQDPDKAIPEFIDIGVKKIEEEKKKGNKEYTEIDIVKFTEEFRKQATDYLEHLATQIPKGEFETAETSGIDPGKLMGGLGCKAGLWWAKKNKKPVYYCLDGINMDDAVSYKVFKNGKINANLNSGGAKHFEVITFAEIREILKHWNELKDTVQFIEKGTIIKDMKRVEEWCETMKGHDTTAGKRPAPKAEKFKDKLDELDPGLVSNIDDRDALRIVRKTENLKRVATQKAEKNLRTYLEKECQVLYEWGVLPKDLDKNYIKLLDAQGDEDKAKALQIVKEQVEKLPPSLRDPLKGRMVTPYETI